MKLKVVSDLHCEFSYPDLTEDKDACLILAGDIFVGNKAMRDDYIPKWSKMFKYVIYVLGNHEYYKNHIDNLPRKIKQQIKDLNLTNVFLLNNECVVLDGIQLAGTTLWTDFNNGDPVCKLMCKMKMNDFHYIRAGSMYRKFNPDDAICEHIKALNFLEKVDYNKKTVVITHHSPSIIGIDINRYGKSDINGAYYSDLENFILDKQPNLWVFGHTHKYVNTHIGETLLYSNPRGYVSNKFNYENTGFNELETVTI